MFHHIVVGLSVSLLSTSVLTLANTVVPLSPADIEMFLLLAIAISLVPINSVRMANAMLPRVSQGLQGSDLVRFLAYQTKCLAMSLLGSNPRDRVYFAFKGH